MIVCPNGTECQIIKCDLIYLMQFDYVVYGDLWLILTLALVFARQVLATVPHLWSSCCFTLKQGCLTFPGSPEFAIPLHHSLKWLGLRLCHQAIYIFPFGLEIIKQLPSESSEKDVELTAISNFKRTIAKHRKFYSQVLMLITPHFDTNTCLSRVSTQMEGI